MKGLSFYQTRVLSRIFRLLTVVLCFCIISCQTPPRDKCDRYYKKSDESLDDYYKCRVEEEKKEGLEPCLKASRDTSSDSECESDPINPLKIEVE